MTDYDLKIGECLGDGLDDPDFESRQKQDTCSLQKIWGKVAEA
jgi:hypothetical protein